MKFNCLKCNIEMPVKREQSTEAYAAGATLTFSCAGCGASFAMIANPMEEKMIKELGVHEGKPKVPETPVESVSTATKTLQWEPEALKRLEKVPVFVRWMAKSTIENHAREKGLSTITVALMEEARHLYGN